MDISLFSQKLLSRLPVYLDYIKSLPEETENISATTIAADLGFGHVQVRKDLAKISDSGRSRLGHSRKILIRNIEQFLNYTSTTGTIVIGTSDLGGILLDYNGFENYGLTIVAGFDLHPQAEQSALGKPIYPISRLESFCNCYNIHIGILAVAPSDAQALCDRLVSCGIRAVWNFTPVRLKVPKNVVVKNEDLSVSVSSLRMQIGSNHGIPQSHSISDFSPTP